MAVRTIQSILSVERYEYSNNVRGYKWAQRRKARWIECLRRQYIIGFGRKHYRVAEIIPSSRKKNKFFRQLRSSDQTEDRYFGKKKKKNIYFANSKNNYNTNIMCKHRGGFPEGQSPSCWTP